MTNFVSQFLHRYYWLSHVVASTAVLATAFGFQYIGGLAPCALCLWQRWPYVAALVAALLIRRHWFMIVIYVICLSLAVFHVGVEQLWWQGLSSCGNNINAQTIDEIIKSLEQAPVVNCNEVAWRFLELSMAGWNIVISGFLCLYSLYGLWKRQSIR